MQLLYVGFFLIGFGGPGIQMATFHMANLFPSMSGTLMAGSTSLFDAGTAIFAGFRAVSATVDLSTCCVVLRRGALHPAQRAGALAVSPLCGGGADRLHRRRQGRKGDAPRVRLQAAVRLPPPLRVDPHHAA